jgi:excisionase family DNA binding protein
MSDRGPELELLVEAVLRPIVRAVVREELDRAGPRPEPSPYLTVREAADYLRARPQRVYDLLSDGRLTRVKDGSRVLVARAELDAHLAGRPIGGGE